MPALVAGIHVAPQPWMAGSSPAMTRGESAVKPATRRRAETCMTLDQDNGWKKPLHTGVLVLASGEVIEGYGLGAVGEAVGEVCFNTAMTGYQEILTDPSYAAQIVTFTFPHIGNVGTNDEDIETVDLDKSAGAVGAIFGAPCTDPSNFRAQKPLADWLASRGVVGMSGIDTRALTTLIR